MTNIHYTARKQPNPALCAWTWHFEDVDLRCDDTAIPGGTECPAHLIARVHRETAHEDVRVFGPVVITETEVTG